MKKFIITIAMLLLSVSSAFAVNIKVEAMSDFSTADPPEIWRLRVVEKALSVDGYEITCGSIIEGKIVDVVEPKRLKRNATFVFVPTRFWDSKTGDAYIIKKDLTGKYSVMSDITVGAVAKQGVILVGNHFLDGCFGPGVALIKGAVKNEHGNRAKSAAISVYESTPLSYANKGVDLNIPQGTVFIMSFKEKDEEEIQKPEPEPNYSYEVLK